MKQIVFSEEFFNTTSFSVLLLDKDKRILKSNPSFTAILGYSPEEVLGKEADFFKSERNSKKFYKEMWEITEKEGTWEGEVWNRRKDGELFLARRTIVLNAASHESDIKYILFGRDITHEKENERKLQNFYYKDHVTGLPVKYVFDEIFSSSLKRAKRKRKKIALMMLDIHQFKKINNSYGYASGDALLREVAKKIEFLLGEDAVLTRLGGDLFLAMLPFVDHENDVIDVLEKITYTFKHEMFSLLDQSISLQLNIGVSFFPDNGKNEQDLLTKADLARYRSKENNTDSYQFYTPELNVKVFEKLSLEMRLRKAIEQNEFLLYFQPQVHLATNKITGVEALIRWNHPDLGIIAPNKFISLAEESGLIIPMGLWVIEEACKQISHWSKQGLELTIGVNLSPVQFQDQYFIQRIKKILRDTNINPKLLEIEITEGMMMIDIDSSIRTINELKDMNVNISVDDFGTGYSSLNYLAKLPIDFLKIDRSFMQNIPVNHLNSTIASSIIALAKGLNLAVVAEGVETQEHVEFLRGEKCEYFQGFYLSKPLPIEEAEKFIATYNQNER